MSLGRVVNKLFFTDAEMWTNKYNSEYLFSSFQINNKSTLCLPQGVLITFCRAKGCIEYHEGRQVSPRGQISEAGILLWTHILSQNTVQAYVPSQIRCNFRNVRIGEILECNNNLCGHRCQIGHITYGRCFHWIF